MSQVMMKIFSSDSSDEDYVPTGENAELSEEDESGDDEDFQPVEDDQKEEKSHQKSRGRKTGKKNVQGSGSVISRKRKGGIQLEDEDASEAGVVRDASECGSEARSGLLAEQISSEREEKKETVEKKRADDLWDSFMKDVSSARPKQSTSSIQPSKSDATCQSNTKVSTSNASKPDATTAVETEPDKVTIVKEYKFAGETVKMATTVDVNSKEAKQHQTKSNLTPAAPLPSTTTSQPIGVKRPSGSGLSSILDRLDKRPKMSTLVKSKLDWDTFKSAEGIDDDLKIHNRGKEGYLERQAFLERTDHRQFEIERNLRLGANRK